MWLSWRQAFVCDDAYISFRYARNLLEGYGLVFNRGEWVEGYTNFAWVLEVSALWAMGVDPATGALVLSSLCTALTVVVVGLWSSRSPARSALVPLVVAVAVVLLATERSFAVWTTSGLETRQFTLAVVAGLAALTVPGRRSALAGSALLGWAALTRPEAWLWAGISLTLATVDRLRRGTLDVRMLLALALPFAVPAGLHLLWRRWAYGLWVPNTYIAKHVSPWIDMGGSYLLSVTIESGLWLIGPLALWGFAVRAWRARAVAELAGPVCIVLHAVFVVRLGGDHFEWRPLDPWWPILAVGAAAGLVDLAQRVAARRAPWVAVPALLLVLVYGRVLEASHDHIVFGHWTQGERPPLHIRLDAETAPLAARLPLLGAWLPTYDTHMEKAILHGNAIRQHRHRSYARDQLRAYRPLLALRESLDLPADMVASRGAVGIMPFHLPDLEVIDVLGLTDATVARNPVRRKRRHMAHDRRPPPGYLDERGVNARVGGVARDPVAALAIHTCAVPIDETSWLTFDTEDVPWAERAFAGRGLHCRVEHPRDVQANRLTVGDTTWTGARILGTFEDGWDGWTGTDEDWPRRRAPRAGQSDVGRTVGQRAVNTYHPELGDKATVEVHSEAFVVPAGGLLSVRVAGGAGDDVGLRLRIDGEEVHHWTGRRSDDLRYHWLDLAPWAGRTGQLELFDAATGPWGHIVVDHVVLMVATP